jgi:Zn-finger nucleic acid-binding protein
VILKLVACPQCHAQFDVAGVSAESVACPCGATLSAAPPAAKDVAVTRCAACGALVGETETTCSYCHAEVTRRPERAGPVCPECYARNPAGARHCTGCGVAFLPQPARVRSRSLECPVCPGVPLVARNLGGLWVDECPMCLGLWAPGDVMDRLVDRVRERRRRDGAPPASHATRERRAPWQAAVTYRHCPECKGAMQRRNFGRRSGVVVDWCGNHGTWLDAHEMEDIAAFVLGGGLELHPAGPTGPAGPADPDAGAARTWSLPADPGRTAALLAAERILAEERARSEAERRAAEPGSTRMLRGIGDLLATLLKS